MSQFSKGATYGALSGLLWGTIAGLILLSQVASSLKSVQRISELSPALLPVALAFAALFIGLALAGVGALLGLLFSIVKNHLPTASTWKKAVLFYSSVWLIFQLLIRNTSNWLLALVSLALCLLWGASFGYLFDRSVHKPMKLPDISKYPTPRIAATVILLSLLISGIGALISRVLPAFPGFDPSIWLTEWLLVALPLLLLRKKKLNVRNALSFGRFRIHHVLLGFTAALVTYPIFADVFFLAQTLLGPYPRFLEGEIYRWYPNNWPEMILWLGGIAVSAGICEEILFRGFVQNGLQRNWRPIAAVAVSGILFGISHLDPWRIPFAILFGLMAGYLFLRTNSLYTTMTFHIITNSISPILDFINAPSPINPSSTLWIVISIISVVLTILLLFASKSPLMGGNPPAPLINADRYCTNCGTNIMANAKFCTECGKPVRYTHE